MSANGQLVFTDVDKVTFKGVGNASNAVIDTLTGKIGVGVDSPDANLHVVGNCFVSTNFELGGTMTMGTVTVEAQHELSAITATGNLTPHTIQFTNPTTAFTTTGNVSVGGELTMTGTGSLIVPSGNTGQRPVNLVNGMIRYNTETGSVEAYTANSGWGAISAPPSITSVLPTSVLGANTATTTFVVTGVGITTGSTVQLEGADGTLYSVFNTTTPAAAGYQISFDMGVFGAANGYDPLQTPYKIRVANAMGIAAVGTATISLLPPTITSLSNNTLLASATGSHIITVTGTGFSSSMTGTDKVQVLGVDGTTLYPVDSVAFVDATSLTFKLSATGAVLGSGQLTNRPYTVKVTGGAGLTATSTATISLLPPTITSLSNNTLLASATGSHIITVTGTGFSSSMTGTDKVQVLGVDGTTLYPVDSVAFVDATSLTFKLSATGVALGSTQLANRPYKVVATIGGGLTATSTATIGFTPIWTSPAAGATLTTFVTTVSANNTQLAATDDIGGSGVTYSIPASNLPSSLTLNPSTGAITGIIGAATAAGGVSVTFRVTDNVTGTFAERTFSIVGVAPLYTFTSPFTFSSPYTTSFYTGPTLGQVRAIYTGSASAWTQATSPAYLTMGHYTGVQDWTVPQTGSYTITAAGSCGGNHYLSNPNNSGYGGYGKSMTGTFTLTKGEVLRIIAGKNGQHDAGYNSANGGSGGGGGSFVSRGDTLLIAGGAGGGASLHNNGSYSNGQAGSASTSGTNSQSGHAGGSGGSDGTGGLNGKGWNSIKTNPTGQSASGGFGGGGTESSHGGGGGGGYSGGGGGSSSGGAAGNSYGNGGGGGGSYNSGTNQSSGGIYPGPGYVTVTLNP